MDYFYDEDFADFVARGKRTSPPKSVGKKKSPAKKSPAKKSPAKKGELKDYRTFTIERSSTGFKGGKYTCKNKGGAACEPSKAAQRAAKKVLGNNGRSATFTLRETTRGSVKKEYTYNAVRTPLAKPLRIERKDPKTGKKTVVEYKWKVKVTAA